MAIGALLLAGCTSPGLDGGSIEGIWRLESFSVGGATEQVELGVNTASQPWIDIGERLTGKAGCNRFGSAYSYENGTLFGGEGERTAALCVGEDSNQDLMKVEELFMDTLWDSPVGIRVEVAEDTMTWRAGNVELSFRSTPAPPVPATAPPPTAIGRLDCSPGAVLETHVVNTDSSTEQILLEMVPKVVRTEADPEFAPPAPANWFYWGYDANETVVAFIARGDVEPPQYQLFTCAN
jgi:heat shock protein HslJ